MEEACMNGRSMKQIKELKFGHARARAPCVYAWMISSRASAVEPSEEPARLYGWAISLMTLAHTVRLRADRKRAQGRVRVQCAYASICAHNFLNETRAQRFQGVPRPCFRADFGGKNLRRPRFRGVREESHNSRYF
ncbi:uncharacterized protein DS421_15g507390 [Arachis hypogaea]|nr:uncharacterized protein DS421_15g507390 [Arachis hypogaea]